MQGLRISPKAAKDEQLCAKPAATSLKLSTVQCEKLFVRLAEVKYLSVTHKPESRSAAAAVCLQVHRTDAQYKSHTDVRFGAAICAAMTYKDCFPDKLPDGLPPARNMTHTSIKPGSNPVDKHLYWMSPTAKREMVRHITEGLKQGTIYRAQWGTMLVCDKEGW